MNSPLCLVFSVCLFFSGGCRLIFHRSHTLHRPQMEDFDYQTFNRSQVPGTKLFIQTPMDYTPDPLKGLYRKDANTYIQVDPPEMIGLDKAAPGIDIHFQQIPFDSVNGPLYYRTETEIMGNKALLYYGKDSVKGREKIWLFLGNLDHMYKVTAVFPAGDARTLDTIDYCLYSLFEQEDAPYVPADSMKFTVDLTNTGFWYDSYIKNVFYYSPSGREHPANRMMEDQFFVVVLQPFKGGLDQLINGVMARFKDMNFHFPAYHVTRRKVGGMDGFEVDCQTTFQGEQNSFYTLLTGTPAHPLLVAGWVYKSREGRTDEQQAERMTGLRTAAQTIRSKL